MKMINETYVRKSLQESKHLNSCWTLEPIFTYLLL